MKQKIFFIMFFGIKLVVNFQKKKKDCKKKVS